MNAFEKIKERLEAKKDNLVNNHKLFTDTGKGRLVLVCEAEIEAFTNAISVVSEVEAEYGNGWIPCSERLPEEKGKYIVTVKNKTGFWILENNVFVCDYSFDTFIFQGWEDNEVIAWMPLPEAYKPET